MKTEIDKSSHDNLYDRGPQFKNSNAINQVDFNDVVKEDLMEEIISPVRKRDRKPMILGDNKEFNFNYGVTTFGDQEDE